MSPRGLLSFAWRFCVTVAALGAAAGAWAQDSYPSKPIKLVVGFAPGGPADGLARIVGQSFNEALGQPVVVDNRPGAGGTIAAAQVAKAPADGYTLLFVSSGHAGNAAYYNSLPYDTVKSFAPVGGVASSPVVVLVNPSSPYHSIKELVAYAKRNPGKLNFGTGGGATLTNLAAELLKTEGRFEAQTVPYKGSGPALTGLLGGEVDAVFDTVSSSVALVKSGKLRALAVTSAKRSSVLPQVPTVAEEVLPKFDANGWFGVLAPAGTPPAIVARLNAELNRALKSRAVLERLAVLGADPLAGSPAQFGTLIQSETARWSAVILRLGLRPE